MKRIISIGFALVIPTALFADNANDLNKELKALEGKWTSTALEVAGNPFSPDTVPHYTFTVTTNGKAIGRDNYGYQSTLTFNPRKNPKTIDILHERGTHKGEKQYGIYKLEGDKWTISMAPPGVVEARRPRDFKTKETIYAVYVFERFKVTESSSTEITSSENVKRLVPTTAAEIAASPEFKLDYTFESGIRCYSREISPAVARSIPKGSPDRAFLAGDLSTGEQPYLMAFAYKGKVFALSTENPDLTEKQTWEPIAWSMTKAVSEDKKRKEALKKAGKQ